MKQIKTLEQLAKAAKHGHWVTAPDVQLRSDPLPAREMLVKNGWALLNLFRSGMFICPPEKKHKKPIGRRFVAEPDLTIRYLDPPEKKPAQYPHPHEKYCPASRRRV